MTSGSGQCRAAPACSTGWRNRPACCADLWLSGGAEPSLAARSPHLAQTLAELGRLTYRVHGTCMFPHVRPNDVLVVESRSASEIEVGEIVVYRRDGRLFGHRAVGRGEDQTGAFVLTRPYRSSIGHEPPLYAADILGVVRRIERDGRPVSPERARLGFWSGRYWRIRLAVVGAQAFLLQGAFRVFTSVQTLALYRQAARLCFGPLRRRAQVVVEFPVTGRPGFPFRRQIKGPELLEFRLPAETAGAESLVLSLEGRRRPIARATFLRCGVECACGGWSISSMNMRTRYRGAGFESILLDQANDLLARSGHPAVCARQVEALRGRSRSAPAEG